MVYVRQATKTVWHACFQVYYSTTVVFLLYVHSSAVVPRDIRVLSRLRRLSNTSVMSVLSIIPLRSTRSRANGFIVKLYG